MSSTLGRPATNERAEIRNPFFARLYHYILQRKSSRRDVGCRRELLAGLSGTVVEVGPGNGPNFELYPATVGRVVAVEPEPFLREKAALVAGATAVSID